MSMSPDLKAIYTCRRCKETFETKRDHLLHRKTIHDCNPEENKYSCEICGKTFANHGNMYRHLKGHNNIRPHTCKNCGKSFAQAANLLRHFSVHNGDRPFVCNICNKGFTQQGNLRRHELTHTGEKPFRCKRCGRMFSQRVNLKKHIMLHQGFKPCTKSILQLQTYKKNSNQNENSKLNSIVIDDHHNSSIGITVTNSIILDSHIINKDDQLELDKELMYECGLCRMVFNHFDDFQSHEIFCEVAGEEQIVETTNVS